MHLHAHSLADYGGGKVCVNTHAMLFPASIPADFRRLIADGQVAVFAEVSPQYDGLSLADSVFEPFFALAEELDIPVGVHLGDGPPGGAHVLSNGTPSAYRAQLTSPLQLEPVLIRYPKLRPYVMHFGSPLVDEMIALRYSHPQVYVDISQHYAARFLRLSTAEIAHHHGRK